MTYLSYLLGKPVKYSSGERIGKIHDLIITFEGDFPEITAVVVKIGKKLYRADWKLVDTLEVKGLTLNLEGEDLPPLYPKENEIFLARDILDKQIVDFQGNKVVRVNDLHIMPVEGKFRVAGVDIGTNALLQRLGLEFLTWFPEKIFHLNIPAKTIPWNYVQPLNPGDLSALKLTIPPEKLAKLHPADLADILSGLPGEEREKIFSTLDSETQAEALQEMDEDLQVSLLKNISEEQAADIIEEMDPDEAADLLADLPKEKMTTLLNLMEAEEAEDVKDLMLYDENSAGGLMTTEFITVPPHLTAQQTIDELRKLAPEAETIYYIYVADAEERIVGVLSLRNLIFSSPDTPIDELMVKEIVYAKVDDTPGTVADLMNKYDFLAVPVVDEESRLKGIITYDDVIEFLRGKKKAKII